MEDTIVSIATSMSDAGIGIIRISGNDALACAEKVLEKPVSGREANTIRLNRVINGEGTFIDEALVSVMRAPFSYTGDDVVEINTHGGRLVMERVMEQLLCENTGRLRMAEPGEFTKRAFLNGKMDLAKAEAVQDLIGADNAFAVQNAARQLDGVLTQRIKDLREKLLHEAAFIEAALDDPDVYEEALTGYDRTLKKTVKELITQIDGLLAGYKEGAILKNGIRCVILGEPNTGKSTLLNLLAKKEKAIVTATPGTTRDVIEETVQVGDLMLRLTDTAGIRHASDEAEQIGVEKAKENAAYADLLIIVTDVSKDAGETFSEILSLAKKKHTVMLLNKTDLLPADALEKAENEMIQKTAAILPEGNAFFPVFIRTSLRHQEGLECLKETLHELFLQGALAEKESYLLTSLRHKEALEEARRSLMCVLQTIDEEKSEDFYAPDLMDAYAALGKITGEAVEEDLLDRIFSEFCLGK